MIFDFNFVADMTNKSDPDKFFSFNQIVAYQLRNAMEQKGYTVNIVACRDEDIPLAKHTLVFSGWSMNQIRENPPYKERLRKATLGLLCVYLDSDLPKFDGWFERVFTVIEPLPTSSAKYVYAGWGADPDIFYPEKHPPTIFVDSFIGDMFDGEYDIVEKLYREAFPELERLGWEVFQPIEYYKDKRVLFGEYQKMIRRGSAYFLTQVGESGLSKIEGLYCGMELIVHKKAYRPRTEGKYQGCFHVWETVDDLIEHMYWVRDRKKEIREIALKDNWPAVADRILTELRK